MASKFKAKSERIFKTQENKNKRNKISKQKTAYKQQVQLNLDKLKTSQQIQL